MWCQCAPFQVEGASNRRRKKREGKEEKEGEKRDSRVGAEGQNMEKHSEGGKIIFLTLFFKKMYK